MKRSLDEQHLLLPNVDGWRTWLDTNEDRSDGVWLVLAKKGTSDPTTLTYAQALEEALCSGWIDGQRRAFNAETFIQRFTPRRRQSIWSQRNVGLVEKLIEEGRMRPRGQAEIDRAKDDGRWERAYAGPATIEVPDDLAAALAGSPGAAAQLQALPSGERFQLLFQVVTATPATRRKRITALIQRLENAQSSTTADAE